LDVSIEITGSITKYSYNVSLERIPDPDSSRKGKSKAYLLKLFDFNSSFCGQKVIVTFNNVELIRDEGNKTLESESKSISKS